MKGKVTLARRPMIVGEQPEGLEHPFEVETFGSVAGALDVVRGTVEPTIFRLTTPKARQPYLYASLDGAAVRLPVLRYSLGHRSLELDWLEAWATSEDGSRMANAYTGDMTDLTLAASLPEFYSIAADMLDEVRRAFSLDPRTDKSVEVVCEKLRARERSLDLSLLVGAMSEEPGTQRLQRLVLLIPRWIYSPRRFSEFVGMCRDELLKGTPVLFSDTTVPRLLAQIIRRYIPEDLVFQGLRARAGETRATAAARAAKRAHLEAHRMKVVDDARRFFDGGLR